MTTEKQNHIVKVGDKYRLLSHEGKNLGTFDSHEAAAKHEGEVEYFKEHKNSTAAGVVYRSGDELLLMKRARDRENGGTWALPAGHIENGETPEQAAFREFHEETGKDISGSAMQSLSNADGFSCYGMEGEKFSPRINEEHESWLWVTMDSLPAPLHPGLEQILKGDSERTNASQEPRTFYCRHMQPGICGYGDETILVDIEGMKKLIASAKDRGIPVYIHHNSDSKEDRLRNLKDQAVGFVTDSFYNELDGWAWFKFIAVDDAAHRAIQQKWKVSNAYVPSRFGSGGTKNNLPFHREVLDGEFTHLAIVPDPRYEKADIFTPEQFKAYQDSKRREIEELRNSKSKGSPVMKIFNLLRQEAAPSEITNDSEIELKNADGTPFTVKVGDMIKELANAKKNEKDDDAMVKVGEEEMPLKELVNRYQKMNSERKNAEDEAEKKRKADEDEKENARKTAMKNEADEKERMKKEEEEKKNGHFNELANANLNASPAPFVVDSPVNKTARGKSRYGSAK